MFLIAIVDNLFPAGLEEIAKYTPVVMAGTAGQPQLRLVGGQVGLAGWPTTTSEHDATRDVATENRRAAANPDLKPGDPRWVLAVRAYSQLQGSTLTPERRRKVLQTAQQLGVRPFDANVIIAIVQDQARTGRGLGEAAPTLKLLNDPSASQHDSSVELTRWLAVIVVAAAVNFLLIWWVLSG